jgi:DnaK suppressor protein
MQGVSCGGTVTLTDSQLRELRAGLVAERERLLGRAREVVEVDARELEPGDRQDIAQTETTRAAVVSLSRQDQARLREVEDALARMDDGSYGVCEESGEPIPFGRLAAEPTARYTLEAQELLERERERERTRERDEPPDAY